MVHPVVYLERLPAKYMETFRIPKDPPKKILQDYTIPKIKKEYHKLNDTRFKYTGLKK